MSSPRNNLDAILARLLGRVTSLTIGPIELQEFVKFVSDKTKVGIQATKARIKKDRAERVAEARAASMAAEADGRIIRDRPEPDGELTPTVSFLDEVLTADRSGAADAECVGSTCAV